MLESEELWTAGTDGLVDELTSVLRPASFCVTAHVVDDVCGDTEPRRARST